MIKCGSGKCGRRVVSLEIQARHRGGKTALDLYLGESSTVGTSKS